MHDDEEIRYALGGSAFFDVRGESHPGDCTVLKSDFICCLVELPTDQWVRIHVDAGDLLVLPAGIYHRFTLDSKESVKMMRLFKVFPQSSPILAKIYNFR